MTFQLACRQDWKWCLMEFSSILSPSDLQYYYTRFYVFLPHFSH